MAAVLGACHRPAPPIVVPGQSAVALSGGPNTSMTYVARTVDGVLAIDLGWWGHSHPLRTALASLDANRTDVHWVFLTHSHRDHLAGWRDVRGARFVVAASEQPRLFGQESAGGWIPRWADRLWPSGRPHPTDIATTAFSVDTTFVFGSDTLRTYIVPGHTAGSAVYLFRGVLFVGDAMTYSRHGGYAPAKRWFSDDTDLAAYSLTALWPRLPANAVRYVCTAHAHCVTYGAESMGALMRRAR